MTPSVSARALLHELEVVGHDVGAGRMRQREEMREAPGRKSVIGVQDADPVTLSLA